MKRNSLAIALSLLLSPQVLFAGSSPTQTKMSVLTIPFGSAIPEFFMVEPVNPQTEGILIQVDVDGVYATQASCGVENEGNGVISFSAEAWSSFAIDYPVGNQKLLDLHIDHDSVSIEDIPAFDGRVDYAGDSGHTHQEGRRSDGIWEMYNQNRNPELFSLLQGSDPVAFPITIDGQSRNKATSSNASMFYSINRAARIAVKMTYIPKGNQAEKK